jgi:hypothetical protein
MLVKKENHNYQDDELINKAELAKLCGVTEPAIVHAAANGRITAYERRNKKFPGFLKEEAVRDFFKSRDRRKVTRATVGQRENGLSDFAAQAVAHKADADGARSSSVEDDVHDLAVAKADKEFHQARLAKLRADELEGKLVDKTLCFQRAYSIGTMIQDRLLNLYAPLAPEIVGMFSDAMDANGVDKVVKAKTLDGLIHSVGEKIRAALSDALKDLSDKTEKNILS